MPKIHWIHIQALVIWVVYSVGTKVLLGSQIAILPIYQAYLVNALSNMFFCTTFLFVFSHEKFFKFAHEIEQKTKKKEQGLIHRFHHFGKIVITLIISASGSPLYIAFIIRYLWHDLRYRYLIANLLTVLGGWFLLSMTRGTWGLVLGIGR